MSNDFKFWVARFVIFAALVLDSNLLFRGIRELQLPEPNNAKLLFVLFFVIAIITVPIIVWYYILKTNRWDVSEHKAQSQIDVETLAAYAELQNKSRRKE